LLACHYAGRGFAPGVMKTTLDLPEHLVRQAKQRALQQGCSLKDLVAEFIRLGLHGGPTPSASISSAVVSLDPKGLPVFRGLAPAGLPAIDLAAALELEQQCLMQEDRCRAGLSA
jgi:hypothetical protein